MTAKIIKKKESTDFIGIRILAKGLKIWKLLVSGKKRKQWGLKEGPLDSAACNFYRTAIIQKHV